MGSGKSRKITVLGSSHIFALALGLKESHHEWTWKHLADFCPGSRIILPVDGGWENYHIIPELREWLINELSADVVYLSISGSDWLNFCLSVRSPQLDFIFPSRPNLPINQDAQIIPYHEIKLQVKEHIRHVVLGIKCIKHLIDMPLKYIEPPPPIFSNAHVAETSPWDKDNILSRGVTSPWLRLKFYLLHSEIIKEACLENDVEFIEVPVDAKNSDGFLIEKGIGEDAMHANPHFGLLVTQELHRRME